MPNQKKAYIYGLSAVLLWATVATAFKLSLQVLSPKLLVLYASTISTLCLLGILAFQKRLPELLVSIKSHFFTSLLFGAINPVAYYLILFEAYDRLRAQEAQAINYTWALTMTLLSVPLLKHKLSRVDMVAALLCYFGVFTIATQGDVLGFHFSNGMGVVLALASTVLWAFYWILNTKDKREPILALCTNFLLAWPLILVYCLVTETNWVFSWQAFAGAAYVGAFEMGFTFVLWLLAMKNTQNTAKIANLIFLSPLLSLLLISTVLKEPILVSTLVGLGLILGGLSWQKFAKA